MACFSPVGAWRLPHGEVYFGAERPNSRALTLPCGQCVGCRLERSRQWAVRCMHEASLHDSSCFVTLTYNDSNISPSLCYSDFQKFMKRLRRGIARDASGTKCNEDSAAGERPRDRPNLRFVVCGEYSDFNKRPHFHALLFGKDFPDRYPWRKSSSGFQLYRSAEIEKYWTFGNVEIGDVSFESAAYVARYSMKKITGKGAEERDPVTDLLPYDRVDWRTGEIVSVEPEMFHMSLKPAIGLDWLRLFWQEIYRGDGDAFCVINGMKVKPPRYYDNYVKDLQQFDLVEYERLKGALRGADDCTPERLAVREAVTRARLRLKKRSLE